MPRLIPDESIIYSLNREFSSRTGNVYKSVGSLVGWWRFNENVSSAGTVTDSSGNGRTGKHSRYKDCIGDWCERTCQGH